ncbi:fructose-1-phosphate/6-phosphogluconate phosphatase, partial [Salmonella enterica subsp. enterica serovar Infantis]
AWREGLGRSGLRFDEQAMVAITAAATWLIAQAIIELNHAYLDPLSLAREKTDEVKSILKDCVEPLQLVEVVKACHGRR